MTNINLRVSTGHSSYGSVSINNSDSENSSPSSTHRNHSSFEKLSPRQSGPDASGTPARALSHNIIPRHQTLLGELPHKKGNCGSAPSVLRSNNSSSASSSAASPARPSTSVFEYRTAELSGANVNGICVGLLAGWLLNRNNSSGAGRMAALQPGSEGHELAAQRQEQYQTHKDALRRQGMRASQADLEAQNAMLSAAGLEPAGREKKYRFNDPASAASLFEKIAKDGSTQLLSLFFAEGGAHVVATSTSNGETTLFDPNYGEFSVASHDVDSLFESLSNRYKNPNGQHLSTVTTQRM